MHSMYRYVTVLHEHVRGLGRLGEVVVGEGDGHKHEVGDRSFDSVGVWIIGIISDLRPLVSCDALQGLALLPGQYIGRMWVGNFLGMCLRAWGAAGTRLWSALT